MISQVPPPVHGQTVMTVRLLETLRALGCDHRLVDRRFSASIEEIGRPSFRKLVGALGLVFRTITHSVLDRPAVVVFFVTTRPASFLVDWALSEALRLSRARVVLYVHSVGFSRLSDRGGVWRFSVRRLFGDGAEVVTLGAHLVHDVERFVPPARVHIIPNTPGSLPVVPGRTRPGVLFLSNLIAGKGAEGFVRITNALVAYRVGRLVATIAGSPADDEVVSAVRTGIAAAPHGLEYRLVGALDHDEKWQALSGAVCLAFTSTLPEAQPLTIAEAFACATPVVAFRTGGVPDLVRDGVNGFLVEPGDEDGFARRIAAIIDDPGLRSRLSDGARATFEAELSPEAYAAAWASVLGGER